MKRTGTWASIAKGTAFAGLLTAFGAAGAMAAPITPVDITVSPSGAGLSNAPDFTFNGNITSDFATINLTSTGGGHFTYTEHGFLPIAAFNPGTFIPPGLNGTAGATAYGLYFAFSATGTLSTISPGQVQGSLSTVTGGLFGDPGFNSSFNHFNAQHQNVCVGCGNDIKLADVTLLAGGTNATEILDFDSSHPLPAAFVDLLFNGTSSGFFVSPAAPFTVNVTSQFSNTSTVTAEFTTGLPPGVDRVVTIGTTANQGGSGTTQYFSTTAVPEPASMALLGAGLVGLGLIRRRRKG